VFFWHLFLLEQMTKEVPGIRPAVISTETGTRLDEYRRFQHVVRNCRPPHGADDSWETITAR
jgi:hypothetical protein